MRILCLDIPGDVLSEKELQYLQQYREENLDVKKIWHLMDLEWDRCGAGYGNDRSEAINKFYDSPVWLLNGIFTECDPESAQHRELIADWVATQKPNLVVDFGGGYGALARKIAQRCPNTKVVIVEPHPTALAKKLAKAYENLGFATSLPENVDLIIAQDVLEHVPDPLAVYNKLLQSTRENGLLVTANCFYPVIKCHLPSTFHFRYSFHLIAPLLGCKYIGNVPSVNHAQVFEKIKSKKTNWKKIRLIERSYWIPGS